MKKNLFLIAILSLLFSLNLYAQKSEDLTTLKGTELCNYVYDSAKSQGFPAVKQNLVNNVENDFPYNIYFSFPAKHSDEDSIQKHLLLTFFIEDVIAYQNLVWDILKYINNADYSFDIYVLFSYGSNPKLKKQVDVNGIDVFLNNFQSNENLTSIIINLQEKNNSLSTSSHGKVSPPWLIQNEANIFLDHKIKSNFSIYYISQLSRFNFLSDEQLDFFLSREIPAIHLKLSCDTTTESTIKEIIFDSVGYFSKTKDTTWDKHFILFNIFNNYYNFSEIIIVKIIIVLFLAFCLFIFILFFISSNVHFNSWKIIKKIWYTLPSSYLITVAVFFAAKFLSIPVTRHFSEIGKIYFILGSQIFISFIVISAYYNFITNIIPNFEERSIDYLIILSTFFNQLFFLFIDISLFPIFMILFILSVFSLMAQKRKFHFLLFIFAILSFVPYSHKIITISEVSALKLFIVTNKTIPFFISLILCPIFLIYFRIITSYKYTLTSSRNLILFSTGSSVFIFLVCLSIGIIRTNQINKKIIFEKNAVIKAAKSSTISCVYSDKNIFTDTIRNIYISLENVPEQCDVRITSEKGNPIIYSENTYELFNDSTAIFNIPDNPSKNIKFSYGANKYPCTIVITAIYADDVPGEFILDRKSIKIE